MAHFTLELFDPHYTVYLMLFTNVTNSVQLSANLDKFECAFINPRLVCSVQQILYSCTRALFEKLKSPSKFRSVYSDIIFYLSPSSSVMFR
jgi:hypothetical protein